MGGIRIYSDLELPKGELLRLELFLKNQDPITYTAEVVWTEALPPDAPARFDVGLKFHELDPEAIRLLSSVLGPPEDSGG
jgi:hypothetical protein